MMSCKQHKLVSERTKSESDNNKEYFAEEISTVDTMSGDPPRYKIIRHTYLSPEEVKDKLMTEDGIPIAWIHHMWQDSIYAELLAQGASLEQAKGVLNERMDGVEYDEDKQMGSLKLAWLKLAMMGLNKMSDEFMTMKHILKLKYDSPSTEQIIEFIKLYTSCRSM